MLPDSFLLYKELLNKNNSQIDVIYKRKIELYIAANQNLEKDFKQIQKSFSAEWNMLDSNDRAWGRSPQDRLGEFIRRLDISTDEFQGKTIFDAGCGHG